PPQRPRVRARPQRDAPRGRGVRRVRAVGRRLDHVPVVHAAPAEQRRRRDGAGDLGGPRPARRGAAVTRRALVVGVTGISGGNVAQRLLADGWEVVGLCRRPGELDGRITGVAVDLEDADAVAAGLRGSAPTHVFYTTWSRRPTEAENVDVNGRMLQNLL